MSLRGLAMFLFIGACAQRSVEPAPVNAPQPPARPTAQPAQPMTTVPNLVLTHEQRAPLYLGSTATIRHDGLVIEDIAASPDGAYPAGSGISLTLIVEGGPSPIRRSVNLLSSGYTSRAAAWFGDIRVTLLDVKDPHKREARVELLVERITGDVVPGAPVLVRVAAGGTFELDADTRIEFLGNSTKTISKGDQPPLMVALRYLVAGEEPEKTEFNAGTGPYAWDWRDRRFTIVDHAYDQWMQLKIERLRLTPTAQ
jgi:hypothetical protein